MVLSIAISPIFSDNSFAQQNLSPHKQWKEFADIDMMTCNPGKLLLQKSDGNPACVMPSTYLKLIDRGYGPYNQSIMNKHPEMMNHLMNSMVSNEKIMHHWHEMIQNDSYKMNQTMDNWVLKMKEDPKLLKNMLAPMTIDPLLPEKMIHTIHNHPQMETHLKLHSAWMDSVHQPMMGSGMGQEMHPLGCTWCPQYENNSMNSHGMMMSGSNTMTMSGSDKIMDMIHHMWINPDMIQDMNSLMLEDPSHMAMMSNQMMEPMLNEMMDDEDLREQMIELMLQHEDFMNTIRHDDPETNQ
jgi:hypothetical protein